MNFFKRRKKYKSDAEYYRSFISDDFGIADDCFRIRTKKEPFQKPMTEEEIQLKREEEIEKCRELLKKIIEHYGQQEADSQTENYSS